MSSKGLAVLLVVLAAPPMSLAKQPPSPQEADVGHVIAWPELHVDGGNAFRTGKSVLFTVETAAEKLIFPRLNNTIKSVYWLGDDKSKRLRFTQTPTLWTIHLGERRNTDTIVVFELLGEPYLPTRPWVSKMEDDGSVTLTANHAVVHGEKLQFEPLPHKNTVGYWVNAGDWAEWHFETTKAATFDLRILQGCGKGQGGSIVHLIVGEQTIPIAVEDTGHFQNFKLRTVGRLTLAKGQHNLQVRAQQIARNAVMDLREVRLIPADSSD